MPSVHPCAALEARANLLDGSQAASTCAAQSVENCERFYTSDARRERVWLCELRAHDGACGRSTELACGLAASLLRLRALRHSLGLRVSALVNATASVALERATLETSVVMENGIAADGALTREQLTTMLNYQIVNRGVAPTGWADGAFSVQQVAGHLAFDQLAAMERVLHDAIAAADTRLHRYRLATMPRRRAAQPAAANLAPLADVRGATVSPSDGCLHRPSLAQGSTPPLFVAGFNTASNLITRGKRGRRVWRLDDAGARSLRALGTNVVVLFASPAVHTACARAIQP
jgi:hypothetical protein